MLRKPDYSGRSIVNLMGSIAEASGTRTGYEELDSKHTSDLKDVDNIILMIVDGLGFNYLKEKGSKTFLGKHLKDSMTSVFLPSTGSAITTFLTGTAPQEHAITGWYVHLPDYGIVSRYLPFINAVDGNVLGIDIANTVDVQSLLPRLDRHASFVMSHNIIDSVYTRYMTGNTLGLGYKDLAGFFSSIRHAISIEKRSYIHAYWAEFDAIAHLLGSNSQEAIDHLHDFDQQFEGFIEEMENTTVIVTGDHGFNDADTIYIHDHPQLKECLTLPLCGDTRTVFCYIRPSKVDDFERYVKDYLSDSCDMYKSQDLIDDNWFGLGEASPRLSKRIGDYTLILKEGYAMMNSFPGREPFQLKGHHGGASDDEMTIPLIVVKK